ncbi:histidine phosphatase family protein [Candidatus Parcubacteria bacterium]|jgi:broad specificity phosphatase PhoE|nr:histidine phosphatase family protein [Candidatus Parcubacteria bacterium]
MKWPRTLTLIRHDVSQYNLLKETKLADPLYQRLLKAFEEDPSGRQAKQLAEEIGHRFAVTVSDAHTPLAVEESQQAVATGKALAGRQALPDIIFVSPYLRAKQTLQALCVGWPELATIKVVEDERIREQEHGLSLLYDRKVFFILFPDQRILHSREGSYYYRFPQGENMPDVRLRNRSWLGALARDFGAMNVMCVTHHLNILGTRANLERLSAEEFQRLDEDEKPINLGVTTYSGDPQAGRDGHLILSGYNEALY